VRKHLLVYLLALTTLQCGENAPPQGYTGPIFDPGPKRVIVICLDSLRADHLGCYGYERDISPRMDALSAENVRFARATAPTNWTLPSHVSLFTGLFNKGHGVRKEDQALTDDTPSLVEPLAAAGFATAAFTGGAYLKRLYGHDRGFGTYWSSEKDHFQWSEILQRGEDWLGDHADQDVFLFLHTYEIHMPYISPPKDLREVLGYHRTRFMGTIEEIQRFREEAPPLITKEVVGRYDAGILYTDRLLGGFLERLETAGLTDNMLLIVTSDHGEAFWEHGHWGHNGDLLGPQLTDVPLIVKLPRLATTIAEAKIVDTEVSFLDLMPTVLDAVGLEPDSDIDGFSLLPELVDRPVSAADEEARERRTVTINDVDTLVGLTESRNFVSMRAGGWTAVVAGPANDGVTSEVWPALFDLSVDPGELTPLPLSGAEARALNAAAERLAGRPGDQEQTPRVVDIDPQLKRHLKALGYL